MRQGQPGQPAAGRLGAVAAPAGRRHRHLRFRLLRQLVRARPEACGAGMMCSLSGGLASMGAAVPYAIAAKFAHPGPAGRRAGRRRRHADEQHGRADHRRQVLAPLGRTRPGSAACCNNEDLNQVTWEQRVMEGDPQVRGHPADPGRPLPPLRRADRAEGHLRRRPGATWARPGTRRFAADRPVVLEVEDRPGSAAAAAAHHASSRPRPSCTPLQQGDPDQRQHPQGRVRTRCWPRSSRSATEFLTVSPVPRCTPARARPPTLTAQRLLAPWRSARPAVDMLVEWALGRKSRLGFFFPLYGRLPQRACTRQQPCFSLGPRRQRDRALPRLLRRPRHVRPVGSLRRSVSRRGPRRRLWPEAWPAARRGASAWRSAVGAVGLGFHLL